MELSLPEDTGRKIANLIMLSSASLVTLDPTSVVSAAFPIILQYAPELLGEFVKSAVFSEAWNALKRIFGRRKRKGEVSDQEVLQYLGYLKDNEEELKVLMSEIQDTLEELTKKREDCALEMVAIFKDLILQEEFKNQISADISDRLQAGLKGYSEELVGRVSEENMRELEKLREEIFLSLQTIVRKDLKELREDKDLEDPRVNIISDSILVENVYLRKIAEKVIAKANEKRLVFIVGEAGVGKSKLLYSIWKKLRENKEEVAYLLNLSETPLYHGVLFYDDFKSNYFDPLIFPALTTRKLVITIRDFEYEKLRLNTNFKESEDRGAFFCVYLKKEALEREFLLKLAEKYLEAHELMVSEEVVDNIVAKSERLPIYITTLIEHCAFTGIKIEDFIERVPSGIFKLIGEILYSTFYKPPTEKREAKVEVWALSTLVALAHWQGLMHEKHLEALKTELKSRLKRLDDSVRFYDLSNYKYLLKKAGSFYWFKHWTWSSVLSTVYDGDLEEFGDIKDNLGIIHNYLRYSELDFDALLKASYFNALEGSKEEEKLDLLTGYLFLPSRFSFDLEMYEKVVEKLDEFYEANKTPEIAVWLAVGWNNKGHALARLSRYEDAITCFDKAIGVDLNFELAWINKGIALGKLGRSEDALTCCDKAIKINPNSEVAWYTKGVALGKLGRSEDALTCCDKAIKINPNSEVAWYTKGGVLNGLARYGEAIICCDKAIEIDFNSKEAWNNKGVALNVLGRYEDAITCCDKAIGIDPNLKEAWTNKGDALARLGRYEDAIIYCDKAIEIDPNCKEAWNNKGNALNVLGRYEDAITCCDKAIKIDLNFKEAWNNKGNALVVLGRYEDAITCFDKAIEINPDYEKAWNGKGGALAGLGRYEDAIICCDKAIKINHSFEFAWYNKGTALDKLGKPDAAKKCFDKAKGLKKSHS